MAVLHQLVGEVAGLAIRAATSSSTTATPTASRTTTSSTSPPPTNSSNNNAKEGEHNGNSSPLLFFVALGFGVVFTNLWIIVGVKYCFRYNARNRARLNGEDETLPLENMPRPHRRRREKKLMTMDEVNEKFPMLKYKTWVLERAREGLPTAGGVSPSRANSIRNADGIVGVKAAEGVTTNEPNVPRAASSATSPDVASGAEEKVDEKEKKSAENQTETGQTSDAQTSKSAELERVGSEDEDDEHIDAALPPECLAAPGDSCAICIDTLEDDDDVRGLTCGHTFHAVCVDPWLTSRRACCPLCKADYYTPKPRPNADGDAAAQGSSNLDPRNNGRMNMPTALSATWFRSAGSGGTRQDSSILRLPGNMRRSRRTQTEQGQTNAETTSADGQQTTGTPVAESTPANSGVMSSFRNALRLGTRGNHSQTAAPTGEATSTPATSEVTPSQLESGTRSPVANTAATTS